MSLLNISADATFDPSHVQDRVEALLDDETMTAIQRLFADTIDPWTPFLTGALHSDLTIDSTGVTYNVPYSAEKYFGTVYCKKFHELATDHWDEVAMDTEMESFEEGVKNILIARAMKLYGQE